MSKGQPDVIGNGCGVAAKGDDSLLPSATILATCRISLDASAAAECALANGCGVATKGDDSPLPSTVILVQWRN